MIHLYRESVTGRSSSWLVEVSSSTNGMNERRSDGRVYYRNSEGSDCAVSEYLIMLSCLSEWMVILILFIEDWKYDR